jgi:ketosteroid isomerase-like protein
MSRENIELVRAALEAAATRPKPDYETINALYHPEHVFVPVVVGKVEAKGVAGYKAWLKESKEIMPWAIQEFEGAVEIATRTVLAQITMDFRGGLSEIAIEQRMWLLITVGEGKIMRTEAYLDPADALDAAGSSE